MRAGHTLVTCNCHTKTIVNEGKIRKNNRKREHGRSKMLFVKNLKFIKQRFCILVESFVSLYNAKSYNHRETL